MNLSFVFKHLNRRALNATSSTDNSTTFRSVAAVHLGKLYEDLRTVCVQFDNIDLKWLKNYTKHIHKYSANHSCNCCNKKKHFISVLTAALTHRLH